MRRRDRHSGTCQWLALGLPVRSDRSSMQDATRANRVTTCGTGKLHARARSVVRAEVEHSWSNRFGLYRLG